MSQTWTMDERIDAYERLGDISPPFTEDERALAWSLAAAFHFWDQVQELPGQCLEKKRGIAGPRYGDWSHTDATRRTS
jgi:hypothetical protein